MKKRKRLKVCDLKSAKLYLSVIVDSWYDWCGHHTNLVKAIKILLDNVEG